MSIRFLLSFLGRSSKFAPPPPERCEKLPEFFVVYYEGSNFTEDESKIVKRNLEILKTELNASSAVYSGSDGVFIISIDGNEFRQNLLLVEPDILRTLLSKN